MSYDTSKSFDKQVRIPDERKEEIVSALIGSENKYQDHKDEIIRMLDKTMKDGKYVDECDGVGRPYIVMTVQSRTGRYFTIRLYPRKEGVADYFNREYFVGGIRPYYDTSLNNTIDDVQWIKDHIETIKSAKKDDKYNNQDTLAFWPFQDEYIIKKDPTSLFLEAFEWACKLAKRRMKKRQCFNAILLSTYLLDKGYIISGKEQVFLKESLLNIIYDICFDLKNRELFAKKTPPSAWSRRFAYFPNKTFNELYVQLIEENWTYPGRNKNGILINYLQYTFVRLLNEKKILVGEVQEFDNMDKKWIAAFNTGLVDNTYEDLIALFRRNPKYPEEFDIPWICEIFTHYGSGKGKILNKLGRCPEAANYFYNTKEKRVDSNMSFFDYGLDVAFNMEHIIDHIERFPKKCLLELQGIDEEVKKHIEALNKDDCEDNLKNIKEKLKLNSSLKMCLKRALGDAVDYTKKKCRWQYKTAVPQYYAKLDKMQLLLPIYFPGGGLEFYGPGKDKVDVALLIDRDSDTSYMGHTVLTPEIAYYSARLICRPESSWLVLEQPQGGESERALG